MSTHPLHPPADPFDRIAALGAGYDAAPRFPAKSLDVLVECGLHARFAPARPYDVGTLRDALRRVGRADLSVGRLFEGHVNALALFDWYADAAQRDWLAAALRRGAWFGVWATEPAPGVRIEGGRLAGAKNFASGAGGIDHVLVTAQPEAGPRRLVIAPAGDAARTDASGWRVRGMRASVSGRYELTGLPADAATLLGAPGDYDIEPRFTAGAWRFLAVQLGGIEALLAETRAAMRDAARADPIQRARFADAYAATRTAGMWVEAASLRAAAGGEGAIPVVRAARGVVERAALDVIEAAARILGTRSAFDGERADKIARDLSIYLRQGGPDHARDEAALAWLEADRWDAEDRLW